MKVATKLAAGFAIHILLLGALLTYHVRTLRDAVSAGRELTAISSRVYSTATEQLSRLVQLEENAAKHLITRDAGYLAKFEELANDFSSALIGLHGQPLSVREQDELRALSVEWTAFRRSAGRLATDAAMPAQSLNEIQQQLHSLRVQTQLMGDASHAAMLAQLQQSERTARRAERLSWIAASLALILAVLIAVIIVRSITDALNRLTEGTREVARGRFAHRLDTSRGDEFAQVARDFNTMTERLDELDRMKRDFVSKVSHDLKTPLASMQETIEVLLDELPGPLQPRQRHLLELNQQSGQRLYGMLAKLLDLSRLEAGAFEPQLDDVDIADLIHVVADAQAVGGAPIDVVVDDPPIILACDPDRTLQLLHNLVENAVKFASPGGVCVHARRIEQPPARVPATRREATLRCCTDGALHIIVSDDGPGVPDDEKTRIFERFFQGDAGRAARSRGVGLGLTICAEIVSVHGGAIWAADRPGGGSEFHVVFGATRAARPARVLALSGTAESSAA